MAKRPVFVALEKYPFYRIDEVEFEFYTGFSISQKQKSIRSLHRRFMEKNPEKVLEVSTKSPEILGTKLSAFTLPIHVGEKEISLECAFQGSKKFEKGGPYTDLYNSTSWEAKKDHRLKESGRLVEFIFEGNHFSNEPDDSFYNWIYIKALCEKTKLMQELIEYSAFTDIEFNPQKSINCQAKALAVAVGLKKAGLLEESMIDVENFIRIVYESEKEEVYEQLSLFAALA